MIFITLIVKILICCMYAIIIRGTVPRYRFDQLVSLNWKHLIFILIGFLFFNIIFIILFL